jgi:chaperonin GroES
MALNLKPSADRVVIEAAPAEEKTASGLYIPDYKVGDVVLYGKYAGTEISHEGKEYLIMRESDIFATL